MVGGRRPHGNGGVAARLPARPLAPAGPPAPAMLVEADQEEEEEEDFQRFLRRVDDIGKWGRGGAGRPMAGCGAAPPAGRWRGPAGMPVPFPQVRVLGAERRRGWVKGRQERNGKENSRPVPSSFYVKSPYEPWCRGALRVPGGAS